MFIDQFPQLSFEEFRSIEYDPARDYDMDLSLACSKYKVCVVKNYDLEKSSQLALIRDLPHNPEGKTVIWTYRGIWLAKLFHKGWNPRQGYIEIDIPRPSLSWRKNPDIDFSMDFFDSPLGQYEPEPWDHDYTMVWYMDPVFNPTSDKIWVMTCSVLGKSDKGIKDMGYLTPQITLEFNPELPDLSLDTASLMPAYWDLEYECAWYLDKELAKTQDPIWVAKVTPVYRKTKDWKWLGYITPEFETILNPDFVNLKFDIDINNLSLDDLHYECVYLLDRCHLDDLDQDDIWAVKIKVTDNILGSKIKGYISPRVEFEKNSSLMHVTDFSFLDSVIFKINQFNKVLVWYSDPKTTENEKIWLAKARLNNNIKREVTAALVHLEIETVFDVFFISYGEPNSDENWQRVKEKAPNAQRIKNVKGIYQAHAKAAAQAKTSMFWVVDGDSYLTDDFDFNFCPGIYDRDCTFIWSSRNPVNGLVYGHSGVKLFPKNIFEKEIEFLDLSTSINSKIKIRSQISNENRFNVDEFNTWKTAFREVIKIQHNIQQKLDLSTNKLRLNHWLLKGEDKIFGSYSIKGAKSALEFYKSHPDQIRKINDWKFLREKFKDEDKQEKGQ